VQKLAEVCIKRPVFATMLVMPSSCGRRQLVPLGVDRSRPWTCDGDRARRAAGASTEEVETQVSQRSRSRSTRSRASRSCARSPARHSIIIITFVLSRPIDVARPGRARQGLHRPAQPARDIASRSSPRRQRPGPVVTVRAVGDRSIRELTEIADKTVKVQLERSTGVARSDRRACCARSTCGSIRTA